MSTIRGLFTFNSVLYAVRDSSLISIDSNGVATARGSIGSAGGPVDMNQNLSELVICDGLALYVWDGSTITTNSSFSFGDRITFIDQRIVATVRGTQSFVWSELGDAKTIQALSNLAAEGSPDKVVAVIANLRELLVAGEYTAEVFHSIGGETVFSRSEPEYLQVGCAAPHSMQLAADTICWLGRDAKGQAKVFAGRGQRISTRAIEERFEGLDLTSARAFAYADGAHEFYALNVPNVGTTLTYDFTYKQWHERAELVNGEYQHWRPTCHAAAYGKHFFGADDGTIYRLDSTVNDYAGSPKCRSRVCPITANPSMNQTSYRAFEIICEKGTAANVMLRWKNAAEESWGGWRYMSTGDIGKYRTRINKQNLGGGYDRVFEVRMTDNAPFNPVSVDVQMN